MFRERQGHYPNPTTFKRRNFWVRRIVGGIGLNIIKGCRGRRNLSGNRVEIKWVSWRGAFAFSCNQKQKNKGMRGKNARGWHPYIASPFSLFSPGNCGRTSSIYNASFGLYHALSEGPEFEILCNPGLWVWLISISNEPRSQVE